MPDSPEPEPKEEPVTEQRGRGDDEEEWDADSTDERRWNTPCLQEIEARAESPKP
jgi:hypothetical protein